MKTATLSELDARARALEAHGRVDDALVLWREAAARDDDPRIAARLGLLLARVGRPDEAALAHAVGDPALPEAWAALAYDRLARGDAAGALQAGRLAVAHPGASTDAWLAWISVLAATGQAEAAHAQADELAATRPTDPKAASAPAQVALAHGDPASAAALLETLAPRFPDAPTVWILFAHALAPLGRVSEAIDAYRRALTVDPRVRGAWEGLGIALRDAGRPDEAAETWRRALTHFPGDARLHTRLADLHGARLGDGDAALRHARAATSALPEDPDALYVHGSVAAKYGEPAEARRLFERLRASPTAPERLRALAADALSRLPA